MKTLCKIALTPNCYDSQQDYYSELIELEENQPPSKERDAKIKSLKECREKCVALGQIVEGNTPKGPKGARAQAA